MMRVHGGRRHKKSPDAEAPGLVLPTTLIILS